MKIAPNQSRAARALLGWSQADLAAEAGLALLTVHNFENGVCATRTENYAKIVGALMSAGVAFHLSGVSVIPPAERFIPAANPATAAEREKARLIANVGRHLRGQKPLTGDSEVLTIMRLDDRSLARFGSFTFIAQAVKMRTELIERLVAAGAPLEPVEDDHEESALPPKPENPGDEGKAKKKVKKKRSDDDDDDDDDDDAPGPPQLPPSGTAEAIIRAGKLRRGEVAAVSQLFSPLALAICNCGRRARGLPEIVPGHETERGALALAALLHRHVEPSRPGDLVRAAIEKGMK